VFAELPGAFPAPLESRTPSAADHHGPGGRRRHGPGEHPLAACRGAAPRGRKGQPTPERCTRGPTAVVARPAGRLRFRFRNSSAVEASSALTGRRRAGAARTRPQARAAPPLARRTDRCVPTGGTLSRPVFEIRVPGRPHLQAPPRHHKPFPQAGVRRRARPVVWKSAPGRAPSTCSNAHAGERLRRTMVRQSTGRAGITPTSRDSQENHRTHRTPAGGRPPHVRTTTPQRRALLLDRRSTHIARVDASRTSGTDHPQASRTDDAALSLRLVEASVTRSPGRHARNSSRAATWSQRTTATARAGEAGAASLPLASSRTLASDAYPVSWRPRAEGCRSPATQSAGRPAVGVWGPTSWRSPAAP
jgi:hypothetical protein